MVGQSLGSPRHAAPTGAAGEPALSQAASSFDVAAAPDTRTASAMPCASGKPARFGDLGAGAPAPGMLTRRSGFGRRCATHARDLIASSIRLGVGLTRFSSHLSASSSVGIVAPLLRGAPLLVMERAVLACHSVRLQRVMGRKSAEIQGQPLGFWW